MVYGNVASMKCKNERLKMNISPGNKLDIQADKLIISWVLIEE